MPSASHLQRRLALFSQGCAAVSVVVVLLAWPAFAQDGRALEKEKPKAAANKTTEKAADMNALIAQAVASRSKNEE